ncbi:MAG: YajG family lipoprotein [Sulfurospirillaceae bacterium]|nr:YajG family lipoprotein [Sulfurospirillaceae bacterium]
MKNLFFLLLLTVFISGCSYKNDPLTLKSYQPEYAGPISKDKKTVFLRWIKDVRTDKNTVGYLLQNGDKLATLYSNVDFVDKYKEGLGYALNLAGFDTDAEANIASLVVEVYIKDIEVIYNDKNFDTNLKGEIAIEVIIRKGEEVITQNFRQKGGKWIAPSFNSKDLEPFLYTLFADSINDIVTRLTKI